MRTELIAQRAKDLIRTQIHSGWRGLRAGVSDVGRICRSERQAFEAPSRVVETRVTDGVSVRFGGQVDCRTKERN